jgi:uncharacterized cupredoxin-like copper-binding protein
VLKNYLYHSRTVFTIIGLSALLFLSACSIGAHSGGNHDNDDGHHGGEKDASHGHDGDSDQNGDDEDHHESMAGIPGKAGDVDRVIQIDMTDAMTYSPASVAVAIGETIKFEVTNSGKLVHEFVIGASDEIMEHHELMKKFPGMEHDEPNSVSLESNASGEVIWKFLRSGTFEFACLQPGHYEAGMKGNLAVVAN